MVAHLTANHSGSNLATPQHMANYVSPKDVCHLGWHITVCWPLRGGRGKKTQKSSLNMYRKKDFPPHIQRRVLTDCCNTMVNGDSLLC
jgi:hypothetical protein